VTHQKINEKTTFLALTYSKIKIFSKTNDYLTYLEKLVEQHFSKTLFDVSESAKNTFFCDVTEVAKF
jgi:hypothetical protein